MALKKYKPITPGLRYRTDIEKSELSKKDPERSLVVSKKKTGGRNSQGRRQTILPLAMQDHLDRAHYRFEGLRFFQPI